MSKVDSRRTVSARKTFDGQSSLVSFAARRTPVFHFDAVVIGAGVAGSVAAISAADGGATVAVLVKGSLRESNTNYAQGGLAAALGAGDSLGSHAEDTLAVGCGLSEPKVVELVTNSGPSAVERLVSLGTVFDRSPGGELVLSREGGHSHARILHALGDSTGQEIQRALAAGVVGHSNITVFEQTFAVDLLRSETGAVVGVLAMTERGELVSFSAGQVVLATGGSGQIYRETTNPAIATGDGVAMALRAGAEVRDMEFMQFHPTCLYIAGAARVLISEIVRGAGGVLRDRHGRRFMVDFHDKAELAPRDVVSRAVFSVMVATNDTSVYLDLSGLESDPHVLFPGISRICRFFGIDIAREPVPVRPGAHYQVGGVTVDMEGRSTVRGLWAVGECASSGLHGANRMGSNSLLEGVVLGERCGAAAAHARHRPEAPGWLAIKRSEPVRPPDGIHVNTEDMTYSLKSLMWRQMGVERHQSGLEDALSKIIFWTRAMSGLGLATPRALELSNMLTVARLATEGAWARNESRGVHFRTDHRSMDSAWTVHSCIRPIFDGPRIVELELFQSPVAGGASAVQ